MRCGAVGFASITTRSRAEVVDQRRRAARNLRASPVGTPTQAPCGVGCLQRPSREHERPAPRLRVRSFPATNNPAGSTTSADFSTANRGLSTTVVPHHPANQADGASGTPAKPSASKTNNLHRTPTAFTDRPLDGIGLRLVVQARPDRPALYAQPTDADKAPMRHVFLGSRLRTPASSPPSLTTEQLPSACGWCHQPPQGTRTPELLVMSRAHPGREVLPHPALPRGSRAAIFRDATALNAAPSATAGIETSPPEGGRVRIATRQSRSPFPDLTHTRLGALRSGGFCCPRHHSYQYGPLRLPLGAPPFRRVAAYRLRGYRAPRGGNPRPSNAGAETDLSCSVIGCPTVPLPIPRRVHRRSTSKVFAPSVAFAHLRRARLPHFFLLTQNEPDEAAGFLIVRTG